ncbi:hypothetical protein [Halomonas sp. H5]|uniref:hypothetical protein n=1 Tax=Halomonas sp. H5 TaxID=3423910 RepID=UPI003D360BC0
MSAEQIQQDPHLAAARWEERGGVAVKQLVEAEQARSLAILRACMTTGGSWEVAVKLIENGMAVARASEYLLDVAAARDDGSHIFNGHSPEGGHRKAIDYRKIYDRHNGRKEARS